MIKIINGTLTPLQDIGVNAGICWGSPIDDKEKNKKRAIDCIKSGHSRTMEYPDLTLLVEGYSARAIRELYTHIIGTTRLQESTRYVKTTEDTFKYFNPSLTKEQNDVYIETMNSILNGYNKLLELGMSKEDAANILPLGMHTKIVWKINLRALEHFMNMRMCTRAYKEIRQLSSELKSVISSYSEEWKEIADLLFVPNCEKLGYCPESKSCGRKEKK